MHKFKHDNGYEYPYNQIKYVSGVKIFKTSLYSVSL